MRRLLGLAAVSVVLLTACQTPPAATPKPVAPDYDLIIRHGSVYDGSGGAPLAADVGVRGQRIVAV
ncbi:MAG: D-aminoacylase, partial [Rudaea sp.]|nr:D-aminoacylase [Rudaea sp.]